MANKITNAFNRTFRDFVTEGVPSTGKNDPWKSEARALGSVIDQTFSETTGKLEEQISAAAAGTKSAKTWTDLAAVTGSAQLQKGEVTDDSGTHVDPVTGATVPNKGTYSWSTSPAGWKRIGDLIDAVSMQASIDVVTADVGAIATKANNMTARGRVVQGRPRKEINGSWYYATDLTAWGFIIRPWKTIEQPAGLRVWVPNLNFLTTPAVRIEIWERPIADADAYAPGMGPNDVAIWGRSWNTNTIAISDRYTVAQPVFLPFNTEDDGSGFTPFARMSWTTDKAYAISVRGVTFASDPATLGMAQGPIPAVGETTADRGWYRQFVATTLATWTAIDVGASLAYELYEEYAAEEGKAVKPVSLAATPRSPFAQTEPGLSYSLPAIVNERAGASIAKPPITASRSDPGSGTRTDRRTIYYNAPVALGASYISSVSAVRVSDGTPLVIGTDIALDAGAGTVSGLINTAGYDADITYTCSNERIDIVCIDQQTGAYAIAEGVVRQGDVAEFVPTVASGFIPQAMLHVTSNRGIEIVPIAEYRDGIKIGKEGEFYARLERNRRLMPIVARRMRAGTAIKQIGYGDSVTLQGYGPGVDADRIEYYMNGRLGADVTSGIPLFDHADGGGAVHQHLGWNWFIKAAIEARSASAVTYVNLGVGGSTTGSDSGNGSNPTRLGAAVAQNADIAVVCFGMNELGQTTTYAQLRTIIAALKRPDGNGVPQCDVLVLGVPLMVPQWYATLDNWLYTNDEVERAARDENVAFVPLVDFANPESMGGIGLPRRAICSTNGTNHPGPTEMRRYGEWIARVVA